MQVAALFIAILAGAFFILRREAGGAVARFQLQAWKVVLPVLLTVALLAHWFTQVLSSDHAFRASLVYGRVVDMVLGAACAVGWVRWILRERFAGALLFDLSTARRWPAYVWLGISTLPVAGVLLIYAKDYVHARGTGMLSATLIIFVYGGFISSVYGKIEIRHRGIFYAGLLYRWGYIEGYSWEHMDGPFAILKLRKKLSLITPIIGWPGIAVPVQRRQEVEAVLRNQFAKWPGGVIESEPATTD
jgi:hypothetical protein